MFTSLVLLLTRVDLLFPVPIRFMMSSLNTLGFVDFLLPRPCLALYLPTPASFRLSHHVAYCPHSRHLSAPLTTLLLSKPTMAGKLVKMDAESKQKGSKLSSE